MRFLHGLIFVFIFSLFTFYGHILSAQISFPYELSKKNDVSLISAGGSLAVLNLIFRAHTKPFSEYDISNLTSSTINRFDYKATMNYSENAGLTSDITLFGAIGISGLSLFIYPLGNTSSESSYGAQSMTLLTIWSELNVINALGTELVKNTFRRTRPYAYNSDVPLKSKLNSDTRKSFFSGHTSIVAANSFFMAKVFSDYYPNSRWIPWVWSAAALLPAFTSWERYQAGKHFPTDVISGYLFGASLGILIPYLHKKSLQGSVSSNKTSLQANFVSPTYFRLQFIF